MINKFVSYAEKEGIAKDDKGFEQASEIIHTQIKALFARNLYNNDAFFEIINPLNPVYKKSLEIMKEESYFKKNKISY